MTKHIPNFVTLLNLFCGSVAVLFAVNGNMLATAFFVFLGIFTVSSLNALRSIISQNAKNKSTVYGIFYSGTAIATALGALMVGYIWNSFGGNIAVQFSLFGNILIIFISLFLFNNNN